MHQPRLRDVCPPSREGEDSNVETFPDSEDANNGEPIKDSKPLVDQKVTFVAFSEYGKILECWNSSHRFSKLIGDTKPEGQSYLILSLGCIHYVLGHYDKSISFFEKAVKLTKETNDKEMERRAYTNLALVIVIKIFIEEINVTNK